MRVLYSIFTHNGESANYQGLAMSSEHAAEHLREKGMRIKKQNILVLGHGKRWSNKVIIIRHLVDEEVLITPTLLKDLRFNGEREASRLLNERRKK